MLQMCCLWRSRIQTLLISCLQMRRTGLQPEYSSFLSNNQRHNKDDSVPSLVTTTSLAAVCFVILGVTSLQQSSDITAQRITWIILMILIVLSSLSIVVITAMVNIRRSEWISSVCPPTKLNLKCLFMWIFGAVVITDVILSFMTSIQCLIQDKNGSRTFYAAFAAVHILYIFYYLAQTLFVHRFKYTRFYCNRTLNFGIIFISLSNASIWFSAYVGAHGIYLPINRTISENSSDAEKGSSCYAKSEIGKIYMSLKPYIVPCRLEYSVLVMYFIISLWPSTTMLATESREMSSISYEEQGSLYGTGTDTETSSLYRSLVSTLRYPRRLGKSFRVCVAVGIISSILLCIATWIQAKEMYIPSKQSNFAFFGYKLYNLIIVILSFHYWSGREDMTYKKITISELILVISGGSATAVCTFNIFGTAKLQDGIDIAFILDNIVTILSFVYQIILIIVLHRTKMKNECKTLKYLLLLIAVENCAHWIGDSFVAVYHYQKEKYVEWGINKETADIVHRGLFPILIYFRLHSTIDCVELCIGT